MSNLYFAIKVVTISEMLKRSFHIRKYIVQVQNIPVLYNDKKENEIFLIYKKIQMGLVAKSFMRKGFLIYEEIRKYLTIYEETLSEFPYMYMSKILFSFL